MIEYVHIVGQIIGFVASALLLLSYQVKDQRRLFLLRVISDALWVVHYSMLSVWSAAFSVAVAATRTGLSVFVFPKYKTYIVIAGMIITVAGLYLWTCETSSRGAYRSLWGCGLLS